MFWQTKGTTSTQSIHGQFLEAQGAPEVRMVSGTLYLRGEEGGEVGVALSCFMLCCDP